MLSSWKTIQIRLRKIVKTNRKTTIFCGLCNKLSGLRKETLPQGRRGRSDLPRMRLPPLDVVVQYHRRAHRVEDAFPLCAEGAALVEEVSSGAGGLAFVPHPDGQPAPDPHSLGQLAALAGALALGAVHVQRQADDDELGFDFFCHLADPGGDFVPGLDGDLRRDGGSQELGAVAGGKAGAAVPVVNG